MNPKKREQFFVPGYDYYLMHWEALIKLVDRYGKAAKLRPIPELRELDIFNVILDESHRIKNREIKRTIAAKHLEIPVKTNLSGSPAPDKPQDLWSQLHYLYPNAFGSYWQFVFKYLEVIDRDPYGRPLPYKLIGGPKDIWHEERESLIGGFVSIIEDTDLEHLGITKPIETTLYCDLAPKQRRAYEEMRREMLAWVDGLDGDSPLAANQVIVQLMRLQQFAIAYMQHVGFKRDGSQDFRMNLPSSKIELIRDFIEDSSESFVIFSQYTQPLELLETLMPDDVVLFTGKQDQDVRMRHLQAFKDGMFKVIAMTYGTGGEGIDGLQHVCRNVILLDRSWTPATNEQAIARINRAGQTKPVNVYDIVSTNTIDEERLTKISTKASLIREMLGLSKKG